MAIRLPGEPIEEARLADVGPADDDNLRNTHETSLCGPKQHLSSMIADAALIV